MRVPFSLMLLLLVASSVIAGPIVIGSTNFPGDWIPFTSIYSVSAPDPTGDRVILGSMTPASVVQMQSLPFPFPNEGFQNEWIEMAPGQLFPWVYLPSEGERFGDFSDFAVQLTWPLTGLPLQGNVIPGFYLAQGEVVGWRVASNQVPEPQTGVLLLIGVGGAFCLSRVQRR